MEHTLEILLIVVLAVAMLAVVAFSRYLQHRETLRILELGGDAETALRLRERWRNRAGLLHGAKLLVVGVVLVVVGGASSQWLAMVMPKSEVPTLRLATPPLLIFLGFFLAAVGVVYLVTYAIWSRRPVFEEELTPGNSESSSSRDNRSR
jgi:hypothetical protein